MKKEVLAYYELHYKYLLDNFSKMSADDTFDYLHYKRLSFGICYCLMSIFNLTRNQTEWTKTVSLDNKGYWGQIPFRVKNDKSAMLECLLLRINILKTLI